MQKIMTDDANRTEPPPRRLTLPRFITDEDAGLGDVITRATTAIGLPPCGGCDRRAGALNR